MAKVNLSNVNLNASTFKGKEIIQFFQCGKTSKTTDISKPGSYVVYAYYAETGIGDGILVSFGPVDDNGLVTPMNYAGQFLIGFYTTGIQYRTYNGGTWTNWIKLGGGKSLFTNKLQFTERRVAA